MICFHNSTSKILTVLFTITVNVLKIKKKNHKLHIKIPVYCFSIYTGIISKQITTAVKHLTFNSNPLYFILVAAMPGEFPLFTSPSNPKDSPKSMTITIQHHYTVQHCRTFVKIALNPHLAQNEHKQHVQKQNN